MSERRQAHSRSEFKRLTAQGVDVEPPMPLPTEDRREPDALEAAAKEIQQMLDREFRRGLPYIPGTDDLLDIMRRHGLRGPDPEIGTWNPERTRTTEEER